MFFRKLSKKSDVVIPAALFAVAAVLHCGTQAKAMDSESDPRDEAQSRLLDQLSREIAKQYSGAKITVNPQLHWTHGGLGEDFQAVSILGETSRGEIMFAVTLADGRRGGEGWASFEAWVPARVAIKRIHPGDRITADLFSQQTVNVAVGQAHEVRGLILEPEAAVTKLEARQTVLEGQMLLSTSVQRVPDVRRGDAVTVQLISNGLSLQTQGMAEEPGYSGNQVRVTASKTKRELVGRLNANGVVEVKL